VCYVDALDESKFVSDFKDMEKKAAMRSSGVLGDDKIGLSFSGDFLSDRDGTLLLVLFIQASDLKFVSTFRIKRRVPL
jgi:hypothetical protein